MPGRAKFKRAGFAAILNGVALVAFACGGADHSWRGEFDARLEGAAGAIEASLPELRPGSTERELFAGSQRLAHELAFKSELIGKLNPPDGCEEVQEEGWRTVGGSAQFAYNLLKNLTPDLEEHLRQDLREQVTDLEQIRAKSMTCA